MMTATTSSKGKSALNLLELLYSSQRGTESRQSHCIGLQNAITVARDPHGVP